MPVIDYAKMQEFPMRAGITGKWIAGQEHGSTSTSVLSNTVEPGVAVPRHFHEYERSFSSRRARSGSSWTRCG